MECSVTRGREGVTQRATGPLTPSQSPISCTGLGPFHSGWISRPGSLHEGPLGPCAKDRGGVLLLVIEVREEVGCELFERAHQPVAMLG